MNFSDIYNKIKSIDEGGMTWQPNPTAPNPTAPEPIQARQSYSPQPGVAVTGANPAPAPAPAASAGKDLGNGFTLTTTTVGGYPNLPAVLDTQSNTYWVQNKNPGGTAIIRSPVPYIKVVNGKMVGEQPGGETKAALQQAGLQESINETFESLYTKIRAIDEGQMPAEVEECGDMMPLPIAMGHEHSDQNDSVTMNISMNGSGDGGIRDLMNILKGIENVGDPHADHGATDVVFGAEMEPEMEEFANSMAGASGQQTMPISAVTPTGNDMHSKGGNEAPKANGGGNPYDQVSEELVNKLQELYSQFKV